MADTSRTEDNPGLRLLSIDGGGIRGLSPLLMLKEILYRMLEDKTLPLPRPCDVFHLAGGTSTGGLIVIMLFRLQMSIDDAIKCYAELAEYVFSQQKWFFQDGKFKASRLEEAIVIVIQKALKFNRMRARSVRMLDEEGPKCFVCAMPAGDLSFPSLFRTWKPGANPTYNCTIVEAARATSAAPTFFKHIEIGEPIKQRYIDGGFGCNNPVKLVIDEATALYHNRPISCVVSLGTGQAHVIGMARPDTFQKLLPTDVIRVLKGIATNCESISDQVARDPARSYPYYRLNVNQGLQDVSLAEWKKLEDVQAHTLKYLREYDVDKKVDRVVEVLKSMFESPRPFHFVYLFCSFFTCPTNMTTPRPVPTIELSAAEREAFNKLEKSTSPSAYHDARARSSSSPCSPGTRQVQTRKILDWIETRGKTKPIFVVLGPAGSGKTSLLNTIAQICKKRGYYAGGFFFSATDTDRTSNDATRFINTLAYQIAETILPELRPYIARKVAAEPSILLRSLESQTESLLLEPLRQLQSRHSRGISRGVLVIDALDECGELEDQRRVIRSLAQLLSDDSFPFGCVLSSRFNTHIQREMSNIFALHNYEEIKLGTDVDSEGADIRKYLHDSILQIRRDHPFGRRIPHEWPSNSSLETIVTRSSGQFIYAATVVKYIESPHHNPHDRLKSILDMTVNPGMALDALYRKLMISVEKTKAALEILGIYLVTSSTQFWIPDTLRYLHAEFFINHFRALDADVVLAPLASVLTCENGFIEVFHSTFSEFLLEPNRSGEYFVNPKRWQRWVVSQLVPFFYEHKSILPKDVKYLIEAKSLGNELDFHQAINDGLNLVTRHPIAQLVPSGGVYNLWPFVTFSFILQLDFWTTVEKMPSIFFQRREGYVPLPILIMYASKHKFSNTFILFELCRSCVVLQEAGFIREESWTTSPDFLMVFATYLANFFQDQKRLGQSVLLAKDYTIAALRCLWYLQSSSLDVRLILEEELRDISSPSSSISKPLPVIFGVTDFLHDASSNLARGAMQILLSLLVQALPSSDLLTTLKQPFDKEVISRNSLSLHKAKEVIHDYLMQHDPEYDGQRDYIRLASHSNLREDEPIPDFEVFLHLRGSHAALEMMGAP